MCAGLIVACVPCLKAPFEQFLRKTGLVSAQQRSQMSQMNKNHYGKEEMEYSIGVEKGVSVTTSKPNDLEGHGQE